METAAPEKSLPTDVVAKHIAYHVFMPPQLPQEAPNQELQSQIDHQLVRITMHAIEKYQTICSNYDPNWGCILRMLQHMAETIETPMTSDGLVMDMAQMGTGDILALYIREQNAAVLVRKNLTNAIFETLEVQPPNAATMSIPGKLVRRFPDSAMLVPADVFRSLSFLQETSNFLVQMGAEVLSGSTAKTIKAGSRVTEIRDSADPHYITHLFKGIICGVGQEIEPHRVTKRIGDEILWNDAYLPWRRSPIWLVIRVALQMSLTSLEDYKNIMLLVHIHILQNSQQKASFSSDLLFAMRVKMARRLLKLKDSVPESLARIAEETAASVEQVLQDRWSRIQNQDSTLPALYIEPDSAIRQSLPNARSYLAKVAQERQKTTPDPPFSPVDIPRIGRNGNFGEYQGGALLKAFETAKHIALFDFEDVVFECLPSWVNENLHNNAACVVIDSCLEQYCTAAISFYTEDTADWSIFILTIMALWTALDRLVCAQHTLLLHYSPEIPESLINDLLLRSSQHLEQARVIQLYLRRRHISSKKAHRISIFSSETTSDSFGVQFFDQSPSLQKLMLDIDREAKEKYDQKIVEMNQKNAQHAETMRQVFQMNCECVPKQKGQRKIRCNRCILERSAKKLAIEVFEWPLPSRELDAKVVVFELQCPEAFSLWRSATYTILSNFAGSNRGEEVKPHCTLATYGPLALKASAFLYSPRHRVTIASSTKSFLRSHYARTKAPTTIDNVCVKNGLTFQLFDLGWQTWATEPFGDMTFAPHGTFSLSDASPYKYLQYALQGTLHSSNQVLTDQSDCPPEISLHEHYSFGTLRSGPRLQWMNIVRGLEENNLSYNRIEVYLLHSQAAWQIGPLFEDNQVREWHIELTDPQFGHLLVVEATRLLNRVKESWLESTSVRTIVMLVTRLLTSAQSDEVRHAAYQFLREARRITFKWLKKLLSKIHDTEAELHIADYQQRICEMAAICRSTYDVDMSHFPKLFATTKDYDVVIFCSVILHDNQPSEFSQMDSKLQILVCRDRRLTHKIAPIIRKVLQRMPLLLNGAVSQYWNGYRPSSMGWTSCDGLNSDWISASTESVPGEAPQLIHMNLLEGRILVNGKPLGRLPKEYVNHPTYTRLFGQKALHVAPSAYPDTQFTSHTLFEGNEARVSGTIFQLIPHSVLEGDLPWFFSINYHHWMNSETGELEFRPITTPWTSSDSNWRLKPAGVSGFVMQRQFASRVEYLASVQSVTFNSIAMQLAPLEDSRYMHTTIVMDTSNIISVELPRLNLTFFLNESQILESRNFRGMVVDPNQSIGTLFGLRNRLALCAKDLTIQSLPQSRYVLIPFGQVEFATSGNHVHATVAVGSQEHVTFHQYKIDSDLGCLRGNVGLTSRLYKIYLHALTSHCLPDPLTGRTGTEEALYELSEPATTSFDGIDTEQAHLLRLIGKLTPERIYYPEHIQSMMKTSWLDLSPLSQHHEFSTATASILSRAHSLQLFSMSSPDLDTPVTELDHTLLERTTLRNWVYYPLDVAKCFSLGNSEFQAKDRPYGARDTPDSSRTRTGQIALWASTLVNKKQKCEISYAGRDLISIIESWKNLNGPTQSLGLTYSSDWLCLELSKSWLTVYNLCRNAVLPRDRYKLSNSLAVAAYSEKLPANLFLVALALAANKQFLGLAPPLHPSYELLDGYKPSQYHLQKLISQKARSLAATSTNNIPQNQGESIAQWQKRQKDYRALHVARLAGDLAKIWADSRPEVESIISSEYSLWFDLQSCYVQAVLYFESCEKNHELRDHLRRVQSVLLSIPATRGLEFLPIEGLPEKPDQNIPISSSDVVTPPSLSQLMRRRIGSESKCPLRSPKLNAPEMTGASIDTTQLKRLLSDFRSLSRHPLHRKYAEDLEASRIDLQNLKTEIRPDRMPSLEELQSHRDMRRDHLHGILDGIQALLSPKDAGERVISIAGIWPRITPRSILGRLALWARPSVPRTWVVIIKEYAHALIDYQRSQRLIRLAIEVKEDEFYKEVKFNSVQSEYVDDPDWLLLQIDGNFSIREVQTQVAQEMISPSLATNTILQLNMGEGKSSVIVPVAAASLADGTQLVRVIVLKPLWRQMFQMLVSRLAGLVHRRVYYLPFGRHIKANHQSMDQIRGLYEECIREGGILLAQPEHILSFKLMSIEQTINASAVSKSISRTFQNLQSWLSENSRDVLDESDEILHVRYQLVYTMGQQQPLEGHPNRWTTTQQLLALVAKHMIRLRVIYHDKLGCEVRPNGQFPILRIMPESDNTIAELIDSVTSDVMAGHVSNLNFGLLSSSVRTAISSLLMYRNIPEDAFSVLEDLDSSVRNGVLLIRGLLACGVIVFALRDRHYRVDYGLHSSRSLLAVPYQAKDIPSMRAEFGHPDVSIVLTCLSYYYHGLTADQLEICFELLYKLDNPIVEYEQWVHRNKAAPVPLRQLDGVNLKDREQFMDTLHPALAFNTATINFFLSSVVFPKAAKQFPFKLSASGWDLAEVKEHVTTGFSGTNDNRYLLPASITQADPVKQSSTNALVLTYLLQPENKDYLCINQEGGKKCSAKDFLEMLVAQDPEIRVLLDVGAQMLEMQNDELVEHWLSLRPDILAAVYFDSQDQLVVLPQHGAPTPFLSSPFAQQLDKCIVYLDDGHTRGTDLDLPKQTRAAVTLGPKVTKDRLLQGCMRMRKLGRGQSVIFCAPFEIDAQIRKAARLAPSKRVDAVDVLRWAMLKTCKDLRRDVSHWAQQGVEYNRVRKELGALSGNVDISALRKSWLTPEYKSLQEAYGTASSALCKSNDFTSQALNTVGLKERLNSLGINGLRDPSMGEEQEREVSHEVEQERQVERPLKLLPAVHLTHEGIRHFVRTGTIPRSLSGFVSLFCPISISGFPKPGTWSPKLLASVEFYSVLADTPTARLKPNDYMRPLHWLVSGDSNTFVALSPFEVNELIHDIRKSQSTRLHMYTPRVIQSMTSFSDLNFYTVPPSLPSYPPPLDASSQIQLNLFAGQLYLDSYEQYRSLCAFLGVYFESGNTEDDEVAVQADGFVTPELRQRLAVREPGYQDCGFQASPVSALKDLVRYRRKGTNYLRTHVGRVLHARQLTPHDF